MLNEQEQQIERYLNGEMSEKERQTFEAAVKNDTELMKKVAFQKDLMQFFEERNPALENTLSELGNEFFVEDTNPPTSGKKSSNNKFWMFLSLVFVLVIAFGGFFYFNDNGEQQQHDEIYNNPIDAEKAINQGMLEDGGSEGKTLDTSIEEAQETDEETSSDDEIDENIIDDKSEEETKKISPPMASVDTESYQTNPVLESLIRENIRSNESKFEITSPSIGQSIYSKNSIVNLRFEGNSSTATSIQIILYDNKKSSFSNNQYIISTSKDLTNDDFSVALNIELENGLYYYIVQEKNTREVLHISKFNVKGK